MRSPHPLSSLLLLAALLPAAPASATLIVYDVVAISTAGPDGTPHAPETLAEGQLVVDDALFAPDAIVPLADLQLIFSPSVSADPCTGTPDARVNPAGSGLDALSGTCTSPGGLPSTMTFALDGTFDWVVVPGFIGAMGYYELQAAGVLPEPGPSLLALASVAALAGAQRVRRWYTTR